MFQSSFAEPAVQDMSKYQNGQEMALVFFNAEPAEEEKRLKTLLWEGETFPILNWKMPEIPKQKKIIMKNDLYNLIF